MRTLILGRKTVIFKTIRISEIVFESFIRAAPKHIMNELEQVQKAFFWSNSSPKIKYEFLCNKYKTRVLKMQISNKIIASQCS